MPPMPFVTRYVLEVRHHDFNVVAFVELGDRTHDSAEKKSADLLPSFAVVIVCLVAWLK